MLNQSSKKRWGARLVNIIKHLPNKVFIVVPSLEGWPTKAKEAPKEAPSPPEVRLTLLVTNPVFQCLTFFGKIEVIFV